MKERKLRRKIKNGKPLSEDEELLLFELPDCLALLRKYVNKHSLFHYEKLLELNDTELFEQYCSNYFLNDVLLDKIFAGVGEPYATWQAICAKEYSLSDEQEAKLLSNNADNIDYIADYIAETPLSFEAELQLFRDMTGLFDVKKKYIVECKYKLWKAVEDFLLTSDAPGDRFLICEYIKLHGLEDKEQVLLVKKHDAQLLSLYFKEIQYFEENQSRICRDAQKELLRWGDIVALMSFIEYQQFSADWEAEFVKNCDPDLVEMYICSYRMSEKAEIELIDKHDNNLVKKYLRNHTFYPHSWQYYVASLH